MEERTLELTIISAEALKKVSTFGHENCYAAAYIYPTEKKTTAVDKFGGVNPNWNTKLTLKCDDKLLQRDGWYITVEIYHYGSFSNRLVGTSKISLLDVGKHAGSAQPQFMAIEVHRPSGKVRGVLNVSIKVGEKITVKHRNQSAQAFSAYSAQGGQPLGYPQTHPPTSWRAEEPAVYPPPKNGNKPAVYPPPKAGSDSSYAQAVYPPPKTSSVSSATGSSGSKKEEPVLAYPATGDPAAYPPQQYGQQYGPQYYGSQYAAPQPYYQGNAPYGYQNVQYSKPSRWQGSSSSSSGGGALGLLGGVLGGLLLGEVIGDIF